MKTSWLVWVVRADSTANDITAVRDDLIQIPAGWPISSPRSLVASGSDGGLPAGGGWVAPESRKQSRRSPTREIT